MGTYGVVIENERECKRTALRSAVPRGEDGALNTEAAALTRILRAVGCTSSHSTLEDVPIMFALWGSGGGLELVAHLRALVETRAGQPTSCLVNVQNL